MFRRRFLGIAGSLALLVAHGLARAQLPRRVPRVGYLFNALPSSAIGQGVPQHPQPLAFVQGMRDHGWNDGANVQFVWRTAAGNYDRLPGLARELVDLPVDVLVAAGPGAEAAARVTRTTPIVICAGLDPVAAGLADSLSRPGRNVTGVINHAGVGKRPKMLALLKEAAPRATRVAFVTQAYDAASDTFANVDEDREFQATAASLGIELLVVRFGDAQAIPGAMREAVGKGANALLFEDAPILHLAVNQKRVAEEAARLRAPVMLGTLAAASSGALLAYGHDTTYNYRRAAHYVDRILRGQRPAGLPIEQPTRVELHVNLEAARAIAHEIPARMLVQADRVFQ